MKESLRVMACAPAFGAPGDIRQNTQAILKRVAEAQAAGAQLLVLPELCLTSSGVYGLMGQSLLAQACMEAAQEIAAACGDMRCVFGLPVWDDGDGLPYNALAWVEGGRIQTLVLKEQLRPEQRPFFRPGRRCKLRLQGRKLPCLTTGDFLLDEATSSRVLVRFFDDLSPANLLFEGFPPDLVALPALQPAEAGLLSLTQDSLKAMPLGSAALVYANAGANESSTDWVYPGDTHITRGGKLLASAPPFLNQAAVAEIRLSLPELKPAGQHRFSIHIPWDVQMPYAPKPGALRSLWCRDCLEIAAQGLATRMRRIHSRAATIGVSGGLDSTLALLITKRAFEILDLPLKNIWACSLPGLGSSGRTRNNALRLMEALSLPPREMDLTASILQHFTDISQDPDRHDTAYENAQARERTQVLMDKANQLSGLMVGSGDLSELALGFTTFGGDHMSNYGVNAGLYKSAIRLILAQAAADADSPLLREVLQDILDTPISPELLPGQDGQIQQKTEELLGPYVLNDFFLHHFLRQEAGSQTLLLLAQAAFGNRFTQDEILDRMAAFFTRFFNNQFKRNCLPDGPSVLGLSLSPRHIFSLASDASASAWLSAIDQLKGLAT